MRRSSRATNGSVGWVDSKPCLSVDRICDDLMQTNEEWNLYVCPFEDVRHAFVVKKDSVNKVFEIYDYQGDRFLLDKVFPTTLVYHRLKKEKSLSYRVTLGQHNEIFGDDYSNLCMKNSAFVMKYHCPPADKSFTKPYLSATTVKLGSKRKSKLVPVEAFPPRVYTQSTTKREVVDLTEE